MISAWILGLAALAAFPEGSQGFDPAEYEAARTRAGRSADAHVDLALWCETRGMGAERDRHLTRAMLLEPDNARARGLLGFVKHQGRWMRPGEVTRSVDESAEARALLDEYLERRAATADDADNQYKLALWCEEKGLAGPMVAHLRRVTELDPGRDGAWRRLGYKKVGSRWIDPEAEAARASERESRELADKEWGPRLEKLRNGLASRDKARRAESAAELAAITDPRAVPSLWRVFVKGGDERRQRAAIDVLSRIDAPSASEALAMIAVFSPHAPLRSDAAALLQLRDPREYASLLAGLLRKEVRYQVRQIDGPGSQGELRIEGDEADVVRRYSAPARPQVDPRMVNGVDEFGMPAVRVRTGEILQGGIVGSIGSDGDGGASLNFANGTSTGIANGSVLTPVDPARLAGVLERTGVAPDLSRSLAGQLAKAPYMVIEGTPNMAGSRVHTLHAQEMVFPVARMSREAEAAAQVARWQMARDVAQIEARNAPVRETNERVKSVLKGAGAGDQGDEPEKWMGWALDLDGYAIAAQKAPGYERDTVVEEVPIAFQPTAGVQLAMGDVVGFRAVHSCFAAGTMVRTLRGPMAIETILPGDLVLTVDPTSGKLDYRPVVTAFHNPPNETYRIDIGRETIRPTGIHRLWKAGHGWTMARDIKPGDRLRGVGGVFEVVSVEKEPAQPVFNLLVDGANAFCVGDSDLIAHDNSRVEPVAEPFDLAKAP
ncbi:polymorphic toxin-type HINT domain-containing protein [Paludisphaera sp.]|uniref:polymorphic toxin-type HINT domain-containing protein n=1 Tax=Paludisphaera sp. TaxID=2017432 RepID=UPI00301DC249